MTNICIAVCTCDRPEMLAKLLLEVVRQHGRTIPVIVADNGNNPARAVVDTFATQLDLRYSRVKEAGLAVVRNRTLQMAKDGGFQYVACIDDDEYPNDGWLAELESPAELRDADIVYGSVIPDPAVRLPNWLSKGGFLSHSGNTHSTANVLLRLSILPQQDTDWFSQKFAFVGGEDNEFLTRLEVNGAKVVNANNAVVVEHVPSDRLKIRYYLKRGFREGVFAAQLILHQNQNPARVAWLSTKLIGRKIGFGLHHMFVGPFDSWHLVRGLMDFCAIYGVFMRLVGRNYVFYGRKPGPQ